jgi:hypothetical protein
MLRYLVWEDGILVRKFSSRIECEPFLRTGCTLTMLPKPKSVTPAQVFDGAMHTVGAAPF